MPVFLIDREINTRGLATARIVSNNYQGAALALRGLRQDDGQTGAYAELVAQGSDTNAMIRPKGFHEVIDQYPDLKLISRQTAN